MWYTVSAVSTSASVPACLLEISLKKETHQRCWPKGYIVGEQIIASLSCNLAAQGVWGSLEGLVTCTDCLLTTPVSLLL